jgi:hypothetical protein
MALNDRPMCPKGSAADETVPETDRCLPMKTSKKPPVVTVKVNLARAKRAARDIEIINREAKRLNKEARDVLGYQRFP